MVAPLVTATVLPPPRTNGTGEVDLPVIVRVGQFDRGEQPVGGAKIGDRVGAGRGAIVEHKPVGAVAASELIVASLPKELIGALSAEQLVIPVAAEELVITFAAIDDIVAATG